MRRGLFFIKIKLFLGFADFPNDITAVS